MSADSHLMIALNASWSLHPAAVCKLCLDVEAWAGPGPRGVAARREEARGLGIPADQLDTARAVAARASALAARELEGAAAVGARILTVEDGEYPRELRDLQLPPPVLYIAGKIPTGPAVAIVGSRRASPYGREAAALFARGLAQAGVTVVSGFARGIDAAAHRAALAPASGRTVAVLGCGTDIRYPRGHGRLREAIVGGGAVLTEFSLGAQPRRWSFPIRNRVIAALSSGTLVIQAGRRSGSLITAHHALELGREVWAVPSPIFEENSPGPNNLIRDGAGLVQHPRDILEFLKPPRKLPLDLAPPVARPLRDLPAGLGGKILAHLPAGEGRSPDALAEATGLPIHRLLAELLDLELGGWLRRGPGPTYRRVPE